MVPVLHDFTMLRQRTTSSRKARTGRNSEAQQVCGNQTNGADGCGKTVVRSAVKEREMLYQSPGKESQIGAIPKSQPWAPPMMCWLWELVSLERRSRGLFRK